MKPIPITALQPKGKWRHQGRAFWYAYDKPASLLALTMGGGKTKVAIDLIQNWQARNVLIIAPLAACDDAWVPQLRQYMVRGYRLARCFEGTLYERTSVMQRTYNKLHTHNIVLINHQSFWREPFYSWARIKHWDLIIADEVHREKAAGSKQSRALTVLGKRATRRLGLTGTPMPHSPLDVYGQFRFLDPSIYGTNYFNFSNRYAVFGGYKFHEVVGYRNLKELHRKFDTISLVVGDDAQGLPETQDLIHHVTLEPETRRVYDELEHTFIAWVKDGEITAANAPVMLMRLHQIANGIARTDDGDYRMSTEKLDAVEEILNDLKDDEPVVIFTRFKQDIKGLRRRLKKRGISFSEISGRMNKLRVWKAARTRVLLAQIQTVKEGTDLTRSSIAIFYSTGISLGDYLQCRKRLHRPPQKRMVRFIHLIARATRDVSTMRALTARENVVNSTLKGVIDEAQLSSRRHQSSRQ